MTVSHFLDALDLSFQDEHQSLPFVPRVHGIQNNGFRWYDLATGRWMSTDPIGFEAGDVNLYRYVGNSVLAATDPLGQQLIVVPITGYPN